MMVRGCDCQLIVKTDNQETGLPYSEETLREAVSLLVEEASIEGDGNRKAIRKRAGVTGCVVTPLTMDTVPLLWALALGEAGPPVFVSETRNLYKHTLRLVPQEDSPAFTLIRERRAERIGYENCRVSGFELRVSRETAGVMPGAVFLRLDVKSEKGEVKSEELSGGLKAGGRLPCAERFRENGVGYVVNGVENKDIYGLTVSSVKRGGTKTEVRIHRVLRNVELGMGNLEFGEVIDEFTATGRLFRDCYEWRAPGMFRLTFTRLLLMADETSVNTSGPVLGPLRYYCAGDVWGEVFSTELVRSEEGVCGFMR